MADMGHYSLWTVLNALNLVGPTSVDPMLSHACAFRDTVATTVNNDFSFPMASAVRFKYSGARVEAGGGPRLVRRRDAAAHAPGVGRGPSGTRGRADDVRRRQGQDPGGLPRGESAADPREENERLSGPAGAPTAAAGRGLPTFAGIRQWMTACRGAQQQSAGSFLNAWPISEAVNLYAAALRSRRKLLYDPEKMEITNYAAANQYLVRAYRKGFEPDSV